MTGIERLEFLADVFADNEKYGAVAANLREIAAQITAELTDREGYESDVLAWVEEHGGLGRVSAAHERQKRHIDRVERWSAARAGRLKRHIATLEQALTRRNRRIRELEAQRDKSDLTHRAPVIAADGEPLREGETVWDIEDEKGYPHTVASTELDGLGHVKTTCEEPTLASVSIHPSRLTHERPEVDSWSRLEEDAKLSLCEYNLRHKPAVGDGTTLGEDVRVDLVRRARALAERGER